MTSGPFSQNLADHFSGYTGVSREFLELVCGKRLGHGSSREVFVFKPDPTKVIKFELRDSDRDTFQNVMENEVWYNVKDTPHAKHFAPVRQISMNGRMLIQDRADEISPSKLPPQIPAFFTDHKLENFGLIKKQLVAVDYGYTRLLRLGLTTRMQKAHW